MSRKKYKLPENTEEDANDNYTHKYIYINYIIYINVKKQHGKDGFINALAVLKDYITLLTKKIN